MSGSADPGSPETVRGLQERVAQALPAERVEHVGGWWLRHSGTSSWWMGTVLPHGDERGQKLVGRIAIAEQFYARYGVPARFQICPGACPTDLDTMLAERGYRWGEPMSLQAADTADVRAQTQPGEPKVRVDETPTADWFAVWYAVHGDGNDPRIERDMLGRVAQPSAFARVLEGDEVIAVGRAVADSGWVGIFGMATLPEARGKSAGRAVLASLANWAVAQGAAGMYLQVERDNGPARRLYAGAGFTELCGYHYRTASGA